MIHTSSMRDFKIEEPTVVTIGKFDGRHEEHQKLLREMLRMKRECGLTTAVFTLSMAPVASIQDRPQTVITTNQERHSNMEEVGTDYLVEYPFSKEVTHLLPEEFVSHILLGRMNAKAIVVGTDCGFGYQRAGNTKLLRELAPKYGYILEVTDKAREDNRNISSIYIKEELDIGAIRKINELLGEPYVIHGTMVYGNHIDSAVPSSPTMNILPPSGKHLPPFDVYVSRVLIDGTYYGGITNIGKKPTMEGEYPVGVETFVFDLDRDIYGEDIEVQLLHFERPEQKFTFLEDLKRQLEKDKKYEFRYLKKHDLARHKLNGKRLDRQEILRYTKPV